MLDYLICYIDKDVLKKLAIVLGVIALAIRTMATVMALFIDPKATFDSIILLILFCLYLIVAIIIVTIAVSLIIQDKTFSLFVVFCILCGSWVIITSIFDWGIYELL